MSQASSKDHISFIILFIIAVIIILIFFGIISNSKIDNNSCNLNNSQYCECIKE